MLSLINTVLVLSSVFHSIFASSKAKSSAASSTASSPTPESATMNPSDKRSVFLFEDSTKWECFYKSTTPVPGLDEYIWRIDEHGNLIMAGLSNCLGSLCYNFDHRFPISNIPDGVTIGEDIVKLMKSVHNCQALSTRVNSLKGSSAESDIQFVVGKFGCDEETKSIFTNNDYFYAKQLQAKLIDNTKYGKIREYYMKFNNDSVGENRFTLLREKADEIAADINEKLLLLSV